MVSGKKFIYAKAFSGFPTLDNFRLEEFELPDTVKDGEVLCQAEYLSVDPYMRPYMSRYPEGVLMIGQQVARVLKSANPKYPEGSLVCGKFGWATHTLVKPEDGDWDTIFPLPELKGQPSSYGLGVLGMPGNTAYFGLLELCKPKEGETVVVTGAAGAVGSVVGQIAKIKGCKVIGFAGSQEKCDYLVKELGFDYAFNYKTDDIKESLKKAAPKGVDCYFDNVGGEISSTIIGHMNLYGRIAVCGSISAYNSKNMAKEMGKQMFLIFK